jgi:hypothetical protein
MATAWRVYVALWLEELENITGPVYTVDEDVGVLPFVV